MDGAPLIQSDRILRQKGPIRHFTDQRHPVGSIFQGRQQGPQQTHQKSRLGAQRLRRLLHYFRGAHRNFRRYTGILARGNGHRRPLRFRIYLICMTFYVPGQIGTTFAPTWQRADHNGQHSDQAAIRSP
jgi:hypothetical protein